MAYSGTAIRSDGAVLALMDRRFRSFVDGDNTPEWLAIETRFSRFPSDILVASEQSAVSVPGQWVVKTTAY